MKRLSFIVLVLLAGFTAVFGQFTNPSGGFPETSYPTAAMQQMARTNHTSCYSMVGNQSTSPGNLYVYSWSGFGGGGTPPDKDKGIAWIRRNPNNSVIINQGIIPGIITQYIADIDVALYDDGGYSYIIAAYYLFDPAGINNGHYLNIYRWQAGGPVLVGSPIRLSHPAGYGRISIDAHDRRAVAVVWQEDNSIKVLTGKADPASINANGITFANILDIYNAANGTIPDVAFQQTGTTGDGTIFVRIVYVDNAGNFVVSYERWAQLELQPSPGINFLIDDIQPAPLSYYDPSQFLPLQYGSELIIDCPDHYAYPNWTYTYVSDDGISARVMSKFDSPTAHTYNLSNGSIFGVNVNSYLNLYPAVAYDQNGSMMHIGWLSRYPNSGYIAVHLKENGNYVTQNYQIINGTPDVSPTSPLSFSKETSPLLPIDNLFTVYPMTSPTAGYYMKSKLIPWSSNSFRPLPTTAETTISNDVTVEAYPNPFSKTFSLSISNDDGKTNYTLLLSNISGKEIMHADGTLQQINSKLSNVSASLSSGFYLLNIKTATSNQTIKVVKN